MYWGLRLYVKQTPHLQKYNLCLQILIMDVLYAYQLQYEGRNIKKLNLMAIKTDENSPLSILSQSIMVQGISKLNFMSLNLLLETVYNLEVKLHKKWNDLWGLIVVAGQPKSP